MAEISLFKNFTTYSSTDERHFNLCWFLVII